jgi:hypothetical protein
MRTHKQHQSDATLVVGRTSARTPATIARRGLQRKVIRRTFCRTLLSMPLTTIRIVPVRGRHWRAVFRERTRSMSGHASTIGGQLGVLVESKDRLGHDRDCLRPSTNAFLGVLQTQSSRGQGIVLALDRRDGGGFLHCHNLGPSCRRDVLAVVQVQALELANSFENARDGERIRHRVTTRSGSLIGKCAMDTADANLIETQDQHQVRESS